MNMEMFPEEEQLRMAELGDLDSLAALDAQGFLIKPGETAESFVGRIRSMHQHAIAFREKTADGKTFEVYRNIVLDEKERIPDDIIEEAALTTSRLYGFSIRWVPGYFLSKGLGWLWGGCALSDEEPDSVPVFIIRAAFKTMKKCFVYSRDELLSHELCHAARAPIHDRIFEEHFAYAGSYSKLRRYMGNCFQTDRDAIFFLFPILLLLAIQFIVNLGGVELPVWPFWCLALAYPVYLFLRNAKQRRLYFKAENNLRTLGFEKPGAVLFRCGADEIAKIAENTSDEIRDWMESSAKQEIRMQVILKYHLKGETENGDTQ